MLYAMDGNNSLKRMGPLGTRAVADCRIFQDSDYYLKPEEVEIYANEVKSRRKASGQTGSAASPIPIDIPKQSSTITSTSSTAVPASESSPPTIDPADSTTHEATGPRDAAGHHAEGSDGAMDTIRDGSAQTPAASPASQQAASTTEDSTTQQAAGLRGAARHHVQGAMHTVPDGSSRTAAASSASQHAAPTTDDTVPIPISTSSIDDTPRPALDAGETDSTGPEDDWKDVGEFEGDIAEAEVEMMLKTCAMNWKTVKAEEHKKT